jgi:predicted NUDIX family NTP pyrophosphohydrolase
LSRSFSGALFYSQSETIRQNAERPRGVAQSGSALGWGPSGRWFKSSRPDIKTSAGILLFRLIAGEPEMLLVHPGGPYWAKKDLGAWSIPKGEYLDGEDPRDCALRELGEELGAAPPIDIDALIDLGTVKQKGGKRVRAWAAEAEFDPATLRSNTFAMEWPPRSGAQREFPEVDRAAWFDPAEARRKILPAQIPFLDRLLAGLEGQLA